MMPGLLAMTPRRHHLHHANTAAEADVTHCDSDDDCSASNAAFCEGVADSQCICCGWARYRFCDDKQDCLILASAFNF